jgi:phage shock protein E
VVVRRIAVTFGLAVAVLVGACGGSGSSRASVVGPQEFARRLEDPDAVVVNVHIPYEGEIAGTDLFVPFDEVRSSGELPDDKDTPLFVCCRSGNMSADAVEDLVEAGYRDVTELKGGMVAWEAAGRTVQSRPDHRDDARSTG